MKAKDTLRDAGSYERKAVKFSDGRPYPFLSPFEFQYPDTSNLDDDHAAATIEHAYREFQSTFSFDLLSTEHHDFDLKNRLHRQYRKEWYDFWSELKMRPFFLGCDFSYYKMEGVVLTFVGSVAFDWLRAFDIKCRDAARGTREPPSACEHCASKDAFAARAAAKKRKSSQSPRDELAALNPAFPVSSAPETMAGDGEEVRRPLAEVPDELKRRVSTNRGLCADHRKTYPILRGYFCDPCNLEAAYYCHASDIKTTLVNCADASHMRHDRIFAALG